MTSTIWFKSAVFPCCQYGYFVYNSGFSYFYLSCSKGRIRTCKLVCLLEQVIPMVATHTLRSPIPPPCQICLSFQAANTLHNSFLCQSLRYQFCSKGRNRTYKQNSLLPFTLSLFSELDLNQQIEPLCLQYNSLLFACLFPGCQFIL